MADAARKLARMLRFAGRDSDADEADQYADHLQTTLDELAWNGEFYTHHVSEDPSFQRDFGVDESKQVSLSNTYALSRGIDHDKAVEIIKTYQRIRREMPESSPAEWFGIYPPCEKGFGIPPWWYTNGGVTIMTAGELAHGAFEHGFEDYGADILKRTVELFSPHGDAFVGGLRGKAFEAPERTFRPLDLRQAANADLLCRQGREHPGWTDDPNLDMRQLPTGRQTFESVPFEILSGADNDGKAMVRLHSGREGYARKAQIPVGGKCGSIYLLHACAGGGVVGELTFVYADGSRDTRYIKAGTHVLPYWNPTRPRQHRRRAAETIVAWTASNETCPRFGLSAHGADNPHPEKQVEAIELRAGLDGSTWLVVAATVSDAATFFQPDETEPSGVPPRWGAGALMYALVEGIGGAYDADRNFRTARIAPRWSAAGVDDVTMAVRYADGGGYVRYRYRREGDTLKLDVAGNSDRRRIELLLPSGKAAGQVRLDGEPAAYEHRAVEESRYVVVDVESLSAVSLEVELS
jgi:hypothetical protein